MSRVQGFGGGYSALVRKTAQRQESSLQGTKRTSAGNEARFEKLVRTADPLSAQGLESNPNLGSAATSRVDEVVQTISEFQHNADKMVIDLATGRDTNVHNTMIELEKADIAFKYAVQLRNRALNAYEELMRIQI